MFNRRVFVVFALSVAMSSTLVIAGWFTTGLVDFSCKPGTDCAGADYPNGDFCTWRGGSPAGTCRICTPGAPVLAKFCKYTDGAVCSFYWFGNTTSNCGPTTLAACTPSATSPTGIDCIPTGGTGGTCLITNCSF